jgi:hypothetical protein
MSSIERSITATSDCACPVSTSHPSGSASAPTSATTTDIRRRPQAAATAAAA